MLALLEDTKQSNNKCWLSRHLKTLMDIGDIVGVTGSMKRTDKGELSVVAQDLQVKFPPPHLLGATCPLCVLISSLIGLPQIALQIFPWQGTACKPVLFCRF